MPARERKLDRDPARSYTLPARYYTSPDIYKREAEAVFFRTWQYAGHVEELREAGGYITVRILDQNIIVIRGKDDKLRAFYNVCSHRAHELLKGCGKAKVITCPYHAWSYHADGRLRSARGSENVAGFNGAEFNLKPVQVEEFGPLVFVNLDLSAPSLMSQAGDLLAEIRQYAPDFDRLTKAGNQHWDIKANWKVCVDNFLECYHCAPAHPAFAQLIDMDSYRSKTHGIHSSHLSRGGKSENSAYKFDPADASQVGCFWWLWPTTTINVAPGEANMAIFHMRPLAPDRTLEITEYFYLDRNMTASRLERLDYANNTLQVEDNNICEAVQRGLNQRGYNQGRFIVDRDRTEISEHAVHHFHTLVHQALGDC
jgi:choline monooxygenase